MDEKAMGNPRVFIGGISVGGEAAGANGDKESSNVSRARCCATRETTGGTAAEALDNAVSGERTRSGWIDADVTDAQAMEMLRGVCSGVRPCLSRRGYRFVKRAFDIAASGIAIGLLFVPGVLLSAAICIKSPGAGPFYSQARVGRVRRDGTYRFFRMWKFRSMVPHADEMLDELKERNEADGPLFKIKDDPRVISGVGSFIRKHSMAPVIIGAPGDGEPTKSLSHPENSSLDLQKCERRPGTSLGARHHYTSFQFLSFAVFGGSEDTSGRHLCAFARAPFAAVGTVA